MSLRFTLYGQSFCFINSHFCAHSEYEEQRNLVVHPVCFLLHLIKLKLFFKGRVILDFLVLVMMMVNFNLKC